MLHCKHLHYASNNIGMGDSDDTSLIGYLHAKQISMRTQCQHMSDKLAQGLMWDILTILSSSPDGRIHPDNSYLHDICPIDPPHTGNGRLLPRFSHHSLVYVSVLCLCVWLTQKLTPAIAHVYIVRTVCVHVTNTRWTAMFWFISCLFMSLLKVRLRTHTLILCIQSILVYLCIYWNRRTYMYIHVHVSK